MAYTSGCFLCGKDLLYFDEKKTLACGLCGKEFESDAACVDGHYICDDCHGRKGFASILSAALAAETSNPTAIANLMMADESVNMHGPEHHFLVPAALLAAYAKAGGEIDLEKSLVMAAQRAKNVPGGVCGFWGSCGAAIGAGIFMSIASGSTPLKQEEWSWSNLMTSRCLENISRHGGPRCCKRNTYLAIETASEVCREKLGVELANFPDIRCTHFARNKNCKLKNCRYFPK